MSSCKNPMHSPMSPNGKQIEELENLDSVRAAAPFVASEGFALRRPPGGEIIQAGIAVRGIDLAKITDMNAYLWAGDLNLNIQPPDPDQITPDTRRAKVYGTAIGRVLADRLGAVVGTEIMLGLVTQSSFNGTTTAVMALQSNSHLPHGIGRTGLRTRFCNPSKRHNATWDGTTRSRVSRSGSPSHLKPHRIAPTLATGTDFDIVTWMDTHRNLYMRPFAWKNGLAPWYCV